MQSPDPAVASLAEAVILYHGGTLEVNVQQAVRVADCCAVSAANCKIVLFVASRKIKEASDPEGIFRALELIDFCVRNNGLAFARHIDASFMRGLSRLLKLTTFKRSLSKDVRDKINKFLGGGSSINPGVATDPRIHASFSLRRSDSFVLFQDELPAIFSAYRKLRGGGVEFPAVDPSQRFLVKNAETSPALDPSLRGAGPRSSPQKEDPRALISCMRDALAVLLAPPGKSSPSQEAHALSVLKSKRSKLRTSILELSGSDAELELNLRIVAQALEVLDAADGFLQRRGKGKDFALSGSAVVDASLNSSKRLSQKASSVSSASSPQSSVSAPPASRQQKVPSENLLDFSCALSDAKSACASSPEREVPRPLPLPPPSPAGGSVEFDLLELNSAFVATPTPAPALSNQDAFICAGISFHESAGSSEGAEGRVQSPVPLVDPWGSETFTDFVAPPPPLGKEVDCPERLSEQHTQSADGTSQETKLEVFSPEKAPFALHAFDSRNVQHWPSSGEKESLSKEAKISESEDPFAKCVPTTPTQPLDAPPSSSPSFPFAAEPFGKTKEATMLNLQEVTGQRPQDIGKTQEEEEEFKCLKSFVEQLQEQKVLEEAEGGVACESAKDEAKKLEEDKEGETKRTTVEAAKESLNSFSPACQIGIAASAPHSSPCESPTSHESPSLKVGGGEELTAAEQRGCESPSALAFEEVQRQLEELTHDFSLSYL